MVTAEVSENLACSDCGRGMLKAKKIHDGKRYCATCYPRLFKRRMCAGCGNFARLPTFDLAAHCGGCARNKPCVRCEKVDFKIGLMSPYGPVCKVCTPYFREPSPCESCGKVSRRLMRNTQTGLRICPTCNGPAAGTCHSCRRHRVLVVSPTGDKVCQLCSDEGLRACGSCGEAMPAGRGKECETCYWRRVFGKRLEIDQNGFRSSLMGPLFLTFGEWLERTVGAKKAAGKIHHYFEFFSKIDGLWGSVPPYEMLLQHFHAEGLRRAQLPMRWLGEAHGIYANVVIRESHSEQRRLDEMLSENLGPWPRSLLGKYYGSLIAKMNQNDTELRSVRLSIRSAVNLLNHTKLSDGELLSQRKLEAFWRYSPGQVAAVTGFVHFLNRTYSLKIDPRPTDQWLKAARHEKAERELVDLFNSRDQVKDFESKWIVKGLAYFHGIRRANRKALIYRHSTFREVAGFDVELGEATVWVPSPDSYEPKQLGGNPTTKAASFTEEPTGH